MARNHEDRVTRPRRSAINAGGRSPLVCGLALILFVLAPSARADFSLKLEPGFAVPLTRPQSRQFGGLGGAAALKALFDLGPYVDVGPSIMVVALPTSDRAPLEDTGMSWAFGGGLRLKRPHDDERADLHRAP